ncbi:MAG: rhomboid family intramembrane serine protease [Chloroflexi bacterium]|nr:rhomboid family intramembrane serine protease [Chloroflexota bacterium]
MSYTPYQAPKPARGWRAWKRRLPADFPWVSATIGAVTVLVYLLQVLSEAIFGVDLPVVWGVKYTPLIVESHQYWRLLTPVFLHGGLMHIGLNMWGLYVLGPSLERLLGPWRFALLYFISAYTGNVVSTAFTPAPSLGASTAIFGLLGAYLVVFYTNQDYLGNAARNVVSQAVFWIGVNLLWSVLQSDIDLWGHTGGLLGGMLFSLLAGPRWGDIGGKVYDYGAAYFSLRDHRPYRDVFLGAVITVVVFTVVLVARYPQVLPF